eukprot:Gb_15248 [translate_table: standard]
MATFPVVHLHHVSREFNTDVDRLVNSILQHFLNS